MNCGRPILVSIAKDCLQVLRVFVAPGFEEADCLRNVKQPGVQVDIRQVEVFGFPMIAYRLDKVVAHEFLHTDDTTKQRIAIYPN